MRERVRARPHHVELLAVALRAHVAEIALETQRGAPTQPRQLPTTSAVAEPAFMRGLRTTGAASVALSQCKYM